MNASFELCSGNGKFHTNSQTAKKPRDYVGISLNTIRDMLDQPQAIEKDLAQWCIFSTLKSRDHSQQKQNGEFFALWADIDDAKGLTFKQSVSQAGYILPPHFWAYTSRSATTTNQKFRIIVPLAESVSGLVFIAMQKVLNAKLLSIGIEADIVTERTGQLCYLPNKGDFYQSAKQEITSRLAPRDWQAEIAEQVQAEQDHQNALKAAREAAKLKASERMATGCKSPIEAFNAAYSLPLMLSTCGYLQRGEKWLSPNSESGSAGVTITNDGLKWISSHGNDSGIGKQTSTGTMGDAFDLFKHYQHKGDYIAAIKAAGAMFTTPEGLSITRTNQRLHVKSRGAL